MCNPYLITAESSRIRKPDHDVKLAFSIILVLGAIGLVFALSLAERRRNFAILIAIGAKEKQLDSFTWSEGLIILFSGR
jgi:putative ABC transport system permease protein